VSKIYLFRQNNSGGSFVIDAEHGISVEVFVEAESAAQANDIAERIGVYFDGAGDCPCCGDRWYRVMDKYDTVATVGPREHLLRWSGDKPMGYFHRLDGTVEPVQ
jgi:hypothetical protein